MCGKQLRRVIIVLPIAAVTLAVWIYVAMPDLLSGSLSDLQANDSMTLYSLDGRFFQPGKEPQTEERFHDIPVLGKIEITDANSRKEILASLKWGVVGSKWGEFNHCFWPRHGIRATSNGETVDIVICFECNLVQVYWGDTVASETISKLPKEALNKRLTDANISLAPEGGIGK